MIVVRLVKETNKEYSVEKPGGKIGEIKDGDGIRADIGSD